MKTLILFAAFAFCTLPVLAESAAQKADAYYRKGVAAEKAGNPDTALTAYKAALQLNPQHAHARYRAGQVKINASTIRATGTKAKIGAVMIPSYQLEDATLSEAIELLSTSMEKATDGEIVPNFIIQDPKGKLADKHISMQLKNVPVKAILDYLHSQTNTSARYDDHAVIIIAR